MTFWKKNWKKAKLKYSQIYFDNQANIQIYSNINNVRIQNKYLFEAKNIKILKYSNIHAHP